EEHLNNLLDLHRLAKRFQRGKATLGDLIEEIFLTKLKEHNDQLEKFKELLEENSGWIQKEAFEKQATYEYCLRMSRLVFHHFIPNALF
ncbi:32061_t:CDS:2, partial [Gigaspora margarita]